MGYIITKCQKQIVNIFLLDCCSAQTNLHNSLSVLILAMFTAWNNVVQNRYIIGRSADIVHFLLFKKLQACQQTI